MRKVLEITFSGEDFRVITADGSQSAMGKLSESPQVFVVDTVLGGEDGYALAKQLRQRNPGAPIIMLASRYGPYDQARGRDAGADDWADKPFDTQQLIDKVRKVVLAKEAAEAQAPPPPAPPAPVPAPQAQAPAFRAPIGSQPHAAATPAGPPGGLARGTQPSLGSSVPNRTLGFGDGSHAAPAAPAPAPATPAARPAAPPQPAAAPPPPPAAHQNVVAGAVNGQL